MMVAHPSFGPIPPEQFSEIANAPVGKTVQMIRKFDPLWQRHEGEKIEWRVRYKGRGFGTAIIKAATKEEAAKVADDLSNDLIDWDDMSSDEIVSIEPLP